MFANHSWLGVMGPEQFYSYPDRLSMPWLYLYQPTLQRGLYLGAHDAIGSPRCFIWKCSGHLRAARLGNWPREDELDGRPAGVKIAVVHTPYERPGTTFRSSVVVLRSGDGTSREAARIYGRWMAAAWDSQPARQNWMSRVQAYQECRAVPFRELPRWAAEAAQCGVTGCWSAIWKVGDRQRDPAVRAGSCPWFSGRPGNSRPGLP